MLKLYPIILDFVSDVSPLIGRIARCDSDLARQLRRASAAVALNTAEGMYARGRSRQACYNIALREMRELFLGGSAPPPGAALTRTPSPAAALEVSVRLGYVAPLPAELERRIEQIIGTLVRLSFPRRAA